MNTHADANKRTQINTHAYANKRTPIRAYTTSNIWSRAISNEVRWSVEHMSSGGNTVREALRRSWDFVELVLNRGWWRNQTYCWIEEDYFVCDIRTASRILWTDSIGRINERHLVCKSVELNTNANFDSIQLKDVTNRKIT